MGATYLSMQLRTRDRNATVAALQTIAGENTGTSPQFYVAEPLGGWLPVFPKFTPELEHIAKALSARLECLLVLLLSADEDDLYCMFFRNGKQLPWFKIAAGRSRRGKERDKLATKLEALAEVCDAESRARLIASLADATDVTYSSELLRALLRDHRYPQRLHELRVPAAGRATRARVGRRTHARSRLKESKWPSSLSGINMRRSAVLLRTRSWAPGFSIT